MNPALEDVISRAKLRHARIAPRKVRRIADLIRNKPLLQAQATLHVLPNRSAGMLIKLLGSAYDNAKQRNPNIEAQDLYVSFVSVDQGPPFMRKWRPRAHGRATPIKRVTSHITVALDAF